MPFENEAAGMDSRSQMSWNTIRTSPENQLPPPPPSLRPPRMASEWSLGESRSNNPVVVQRSSTYLSIGSPPTDHGPSGGNSSTSPENEDPSGRSLDTQQQLSYKRKAHELQAGQASEAGSSSCIGVPMQAENELVGNNGSEQVNSRLRLGNGRAASVENRNFRLRINGVSGNPSDAGNADANPHNRLLDMNPAQLRWSGSSTSRTMNGSSNSTERDYYSLLEESASRNIPQTILEHPAFISGNETGNPSQQSTNWIFPSGSHTLASNVAPTGSSTRAGEPMLTQRNRPLYTRRLSEIVRRSLLNSAGAEPGGPTVHNAPPSSSAVAPSEGITISSSDNQSRRLTNARSAWLERQLESDQFRLPNLLRNLATAGEGRNNVMSEIRNVLDIMRRGGGDALRFEEMMMLDHPVFAGLADMHDRHRDMRLDVDNMSYEELLALEERIGDVCTGLKEDDIATHLKHKKYTNEKSTNQDHTDPEPCSICREEYEDGEDLGTLECGHDFHKDCIKQWLMHKNLCPICKTSGLQA